MSAENRILSLRHFWPNAEFIGCSDIQIRSLSRDSRTTQPGQTFVALRGPDFDGHHYVHEAAQRGANAVIVESSSRTLELPQCVLGNTRAAYGTLCQALARNPSKRLQVIGITGTNGKTTTAYLIRAILDEAGGRTGLIGTVEHFDGQTSFPASLTTPDAQVLARLMARMSEVGSSAVVMEVSSHALDQRRVAGIEFDVAVFTNLAHDHLDYHPDHASYLRAKQRLFESLDPGARAVLNADDPASKSFAAHCACPTFSYAVKHPADLTVADIRGDNQGTSFRIAGAAGTGQFRTWLPGNHNLQNCLAAAAAARQIGLDWETIQAGIARVHEIPGRLQPIRCGQPFDVFIDYAHTPAALAAVLQSLRGVARGRLLCLFGAGGDRDRTKRPQMARVVEDYADLVVLSSDNPRTERPQAIIQDIMAGFTRAQAVAVEPDRETAIGLVLRAARPGDCVVIAGKGHETYQIIGSRQLFFDDRVVASELLRRLAGTARAPWASESRAAGPDQEFRRAACGA